MRRDLVQDDAAEAFADIAVHQQDQRPSVAERARKGIADTGCDRVQARVRRVPLPRECECDGTFSFREIRPGEGGTDFGSNCTRGDLAIQAEVACQHREVLQRQLGRIGDEDGVAADLDRELRRPDHGGADPLAGVPHGRQIAPVRERMAQLFRKI